MTFLAMDTSGDYTVLALADESSGGAIIAVTVFEGLRSLSRRLLGRVDSLLKENEIALEDLSAFAVGIGPGSFTGIRVGVTTAKTLAQVLGKPLLGIGTMEAYSTVWGTGNDCFVVPILPSRRGEVYAAVYQRGLAVRAPFAAPIAEMDALLEALRAQNEVILCGRPDLIPTTNLPCLRQLCPPPVGFAKLAAARLINGDTDDPLSLVPLYVVAPAISTPKDLKILPSKPI